MNDTLRSAIREAFEFLLHDRRDEGPVFTEVQALEAQRWLNDDAIQTLSTDLARVLVPTEKTPMEALQAIKRDIDEGFSESTLLLRVMAHLNAAGVPVEMEPVTGPDPRD